jgi:hypothetical protein
MCLMWSRNGICCFGTIQNVSPNAEDRYVHSFTLAFNASRPLNIFSFSVCFCSHFQLGFALEYLTNSEHLQNVLVITNIKPQFFLTLCKCVRYLSFNCSVMWHIKLDSNDAAVRNSSLWLQSLETQNESGLSYLPLIIEKTLNTLWTGDADSRLCITTVEDGRRTSAFLTRAWFPRTIHFNCAIHAAFLRIVLLTDVYRNVTSPRSNDLW